MSLPRTPKPFRAGTHRLVPPEQTLARAQRLMPVLGITRLANVTGLDTLGLPVVMVTRPNARSLSVAQGKGLTLTAAKVSGLMEAIESYHAEHITLPLKLATHQQLRFSHRLVDVAALPRCAPGGFHEHLRTLWVEGRSLFDGGSRWLPYELVHTDFTLPLPPGSGCFMMSSSGLASGNHLTEALSHGLCELLERDATTLWWLRGREEKLRTRVALESVEDPACREVLERYERAGVAVTLWDVTSDTGVAAFRCAIAPGELDPQRPLGPMGGLGCHPAREIALLRALTEAAQSRLTLISGARDDMFSQRLEPAALRQRLRQFHEHREAAGPRRRFSEVPTHESDTFEGDVEWVLERLRAVGLGEAVGVDLSKPELGVPVVRVMVPGLEVLHELPGYTPGARARAVLAAREEAGA
ncbi:YcaO-like family protein [Archangium gephyra]|uniref:YcaO-like family protein n=1 Tax=Archangium gephyra TaxID=48 RepID=UPI0035D52034